MRILLIALALFAFPAQTTSQVDYVGTVPCGDVVRAFVGGLAAGAPCHAIKLQVRFRAGASGPGRWTLNAAYSVPPESDPNQMIDGPRVSLEGTLERTQGAKYDPAATVYRLAVDAKRSLSLLELDGSVLHALGADGDVAVGTDGWSYTLYRADRVEPPAEPGPPSDVSYTIQPRASGRTVFGVFEGRTPCVNIARELTGAPVRGCVKAKWSITLFWDPDSKQPTTYRVEGSLYRRGPRTGTWHNGRGTGLNPDATVYQLDAAANEAPILLLRGSNNVLFFLDGGRSLLVGTKDFSYTLNRTGAR